ncbi:hypothetical protein SpCBS45565_g01878 [Spizellomyces sp. 'palustris']|nr:hypothetical protein SpCBS45565_g01878 [Spizellomyces sp. 'palustris']
MCELLMGKLRAHPTGTVAYPFIERLSEAQPENSSRLSLWPQDLVRHVSFKEESGLFDFSKHYYQQRFEYIDEWEDITLRAYLESSLKGQEEESTTKNVDRQVLEAAERVGLGHLLDLSFMKLSNGQMRRARIAKFLLAKPQYLLVDEPFMGLDVKSRREISDLLGQVADQGLTEVILTLRPQDELPEWVTHVLSLNRDRAIRWQGLRDQWSQQAPTGSILSQHQGFDNKKHVDVECQSEPVVELQNVNLSFGGTPILRDVSWTVRVGERWALMGHNGSGKSTLLSLLLGDNPQAYSNDISLFGKKRGTGETIWDIKSQTGFSSPELHMYFTKPLSCREVIATGFFDIPALIRSPTPAQDKVINAFLSEFCIEHLGDRPFRQLSTGEQRFVLLVRALIKEPRLLVLDEPFQGLDEEAVERAKRWLDTKLRKDQTLIFVTHCLEEIPASVDRLLTLEGGRVVKHV